jgi:hypothetical protein
LPGNRGATPVTLGFSKGDNILLPVATSTRTIRTPLLLLGIILLLSALMLLALTRSSGQLGARYVRACSAAARENNRVSCWHAYNLINASNHGARQQCSALCNTMGLVRRAGEI